MPLTSETIMMKPSTKNGSPTTVIVSCSAVSPASPAPMSRIAATRPVSTAHTTRCTGFDLVSSPSAIMSKTIDDESIDVVKKMTTMMTENSDSTGASGKCDRNSNSAPGTSP